ncbi:MAG: hypothetical protein HPY52_16010 [Firmicutes bacterium]|nr:hypothetical protein [Bacillota bacterium]
MKRRWRSLKGRGYRGILPINHHAAVVAPSIRSLVKLAFSDEAPGMLVHTLNRFIGRWGATLGWLNTVLQYMYYITEGLTMVLMIDAFQIAGDHRFPGIRAPWGAIGLALVWGGAHLFTKDPTVALISIWRGLLIGALYLPARREPWPSLALWMTLLVL